MICIECKNGIEDGYSGVIDREGNWYHRDCWTKHLLNGVAALRQQRDELLAACRGLLRWLNEIYPPENFTGKSGDPGPVRVALLRMVAERAIAKAEGK